MLERETGAERRHRHADTVTATNVLAIRRRAVTRGKEMVARASKGSRGARETCHRSTGRGRAPPGSRVVDVAVAVVVVAVISDRSNTGSIVKFVSAGVSSLRSPARLPRILINSPLFRRPRDHSISFSSDTVDRPSLPPPSFLSSVRNDRQKLSRSTFSAMLRINYGIMSARYVFRRDVAAANFVALVPFGRKIIFRRGSRTRIIIAKIIIKDSCTFDPSNDVVVASFRLPRESISDKRNISDWLIALIQKAPRHRAIRGNFIGRTRDYFEGA